ncbi:MAG: NERD domain-containing protein [Ilumatobacteraceae bacterium]
MATLLPADFDLTTLADAERAVCRAFLDGLDDSWVLVPNVGITVDREDAEIDLVLASPTHGIVLVETKGGDVRLKDGVWFQYERRLKRSPVVQVMRAKHELLKRCRACSVDVRDLDLRHVVALPAVGSVPPEGLGPDAPAETLFSRDRLDHPAVALARVLRERPPVPKDVFDRFLQLLRPDVVLDGTPRRVLDWARARLDDETRVHLTQLAQLDQYNRRVLVQGGAGTGKTLLAVRWARQAVARGERTLLLSFNKPVGGLLCQSVGGRPLDAPVEDVSDVDVSDVDVSDVDVSVAGEPDVAAPPRLVVGHFHQVVRHLIEPFGFRIEAPLTPEFWLDGFTDGLAQYAAELGTPFDTIVVDEGQDFHPHWIAALERLLDPAGARRLLMVADPGQAIYVDGWVPPPDMVTMPLTYNLRNCAAVARVVQRLGGPAPLPSAPVGDRVQHLPAGGHKEVRKRVRDAVERLTGEYCVPFSEIAVVTTRADVRDRLLAEQPDGVPLVRWEDRAEDAVLCETVHRAKGLERTAIVLVDMSGEPDHRLLYIGASRAVVSLQLVGPPALAHAVKVTPG